MEHQAIVEEIERTKALLGEHRKYLKKLELKAAKFGLHIPPYMEVDIDSTKEKIELCIKRLDLMVDGNNAIVDVRNKADELIGLLAIDVKEAVEFADWNTNMVTATKIQELGIEIAGMIVSIDKMNKEYNEATTQYSDLL